MESPLITLGSIPQQAPNVVSRQIEDEAVLVHPVQGKVRVLNAVGARVWELADGQHTVAEIAQMITAEYEVDLPSRRSRCIDLLCWIGSGWSLDLRMMVFLGRVVQALLI